MDDNIINIILRTENDYRETIEKAVTAAGSYTEDCRNGQNDFFNELRDEYHIFEKTEREQFEEALRLGMSEMDEEHAMMKKRLKACQEQKAGLISERLKKEVLAIYGDS